MSDVPCSPPQQPGMGGPGGPPQQSYGAPQGWGNAYQQWNQSAPADPSKLCYLLRGSAPADPSKLCYSLRGSAPADSSKLCYSLLGSWYLQVIKRYV